MNDTGISIQNVNLIAYNSNVNKACPADFADRIHADLRRKICDHLRAFSSAPSAGKGSSVIIAVANCKPNCD